MRIRPASPADLPFLEAMLVEAACWRPGTASAPARHVLAEPAVARYLEGWGRSGDTGLVAEAGGSAVGAAWFRVFEADDAGYGFVAADVPELTIAVTAGARGQGVGTFLLDALVAEARAGGFRALSLSVEEDNPALRLYEHAGFVRAGRVGGAWTMLLEL